MREHPIVVPPKDLCHPRGNILLQIGIRKKNRGSFRKLIRLLNLCC